MIRNISPRKMLNKQTVKNQLREAEFKQNYQNLERQQVQLNGHKKKKKKRKEKIKTDSNGFAGSQH